MIRPKLSGALFVALALLPACGPGQVIATAEVEVLNPDTQQREARPVSDLEIQLLPFDRDAIFDSLTGVAARPEPQLPEALVIARDSIAAARTQWQQSEQAWLAARDRMQLVSDSIGMFNRAEPQYQRLYQDFLRAEGAEQQAARVKDQAFALFERLQQATLTEMESFAAQVAAWEDETFSDYGTIVTTRLREMSREIHYDTTDATGMVRFEAQPGEWWIYGRVPVATDELYWNHPVTITRDAPAEVHLNPSNAEVRQIL